MISVVIAAYNSEKYIAECLESVLTQTYRDMEIIVVDDGSTDCTWEIIQEYKNRDPRIVAIQQENQGPAAARNKAFDIMKGDYFTVLDSDDWIDKECYSMAIEAANTTNADMVIWGFQRFTEKSTVPQKAVTTPLGLSDVKTCRKLWLDFIYQEGHRINPFPHCRLIRTSILRDRGLQLDSKLVRSEDFMLLCKIHFYCTKIFSMEDKMYLHYRQVEGSITHRYVPGYFDMVLRIYDRLIQFAEENNVLNLECKKHIDRMLVYRLLLCVENEFYHSVSKSARIKNLKSFLSHDTIRAAVKSIGLSDGMRLYGKKYLALRLSMPSVLHMAYGS